ncbi:MAG: hypothetical protein ACP5D9_14710 [Mariniphaga sp.]
MKAIEQLERLKKINKLIKSERTGTPEEFAGELGICQSHLYNLIEELKIMGAPIRYSRTRQTYFYTTEFEIKLHYSLCFIKRDQLKQIFGGYLIKTAYSNFFRVKENNLVAG